MNNEDYRSSLAHASAALVHLKALGGETDAFKKQMLFAMAGGELATALKFLSESMEGERVAGGEAPSLTGCYGQNLL